jgi:hypothetical protein
VRDPMVSYEYLLWQLLSSLVRSSYGISRTSAWRADSHNNPDSYCRTGYHVLFGRRRSRVRTRRPIFDS